MTTGSLCLTLILKSWKSCSSKRDASHTADSTSASGVALPYRSITRGSGARAPAPRRGGRAQGGPPPPRGPPRRRGGGLAVPRQRAGVERPGVDADPDGDTGVL